MKVLNATTVTRQDILLEIAEANVNQDQDQENTSKSFQKIIWLLKIIPFIVAEEEIMAVAAITTGEEILKIANKVEDREAEVGTEAWTEDDEEVTLVTTTER